MKLVDPFNFTKFDRTPAELEAMVLFCIMVANKRADQTYKKFEALMRYGPDLSPFGKVAWMVRRGLLRYLRAVRAGQYTRIAAAFKAVLALDLRTCTVDQLEACHGIGPKTARMFLLHSRPNQRIAVLDTHILAFLRETLPYLNAPRSTPPAGPVYRRLEDAFLTFCDITGYSPATLDLQIWNDRSRSRLSA